MKIDINKILEVNYLKSLVLQINDEISVLNSEFTNKYDINTIAEMDEEDIKSLFKKFDISYGNVVEKIKMTSFDDWDFGDLFDDDRDYAKGFEIDIRNRALSDIDDLNKKIQIKNNENKKKITELENKLEFINAFLRVLDNDGYVLESDISNLELIIKDSDFIETDKFSLSVSIVNHLIEKNIQIEKIVQKDEFNDDKLVIEEFELVLDKVYESSNYSNVEDDSFAYFALEEVNPDIKFNFISEGGANTRG